MSLARGHARVAVFSAYYPTHGGGMELATEELVRRLRHESPKRSTLRKSVLAKIFHIPGQIFDVQALRAYGLIKN